MNFLADARITWSPDFQFPVTRPNRSWASSTSASTLRSHRINILLQGEERETERMISFFYLSLYRELSPHYHRKKMSLPSSQSYCILAMKARGTCAIYRERGWRTRKAAERVAKWDVLIRAGFRNLVLRTGVSSALSGILALSHLAREDL